MGILKPAKFLINSSGQAEKFQKVPEFMTRT